MKIEIKPAYTVADLKKQFHGFFPYLKIEFFKEAHSVSGSSVRTSMLDNDTLLSEIMKEPKEGTAEFTALSTVESFEQLFASGFGLNVQVFRKSGQVYLETTSTDSWSLGQQNAEGKDSAQVQAGEEPADMTDRDQVE